MEDHEVFFTMKFCRQRGGPVSVSAARMEIGITVVLLVKRAMLFVA